jgi:O-antigen/teichoic acid export membrane protein
MLLRIKKFLSSDWGIYIIRAGVVGTNLISLLLIALMMEQTDFGKFVFMFSAALTLSAIASVGAPTLLLRELSASIETGKVGMSRKQLLLLVVVWPSIILLVVAALFLTLQTPLFSLIQRPVVPIGHVFLVLIFANLINLTNILSVVFRVQGYTGTSMAFRDAGPQAVMLIATSAAAFFTQPQPETVLTIGIGILFVSLAIGILWLSDSLKDQLDKLSKKSSSISVTGFWGTTVANMAWTQIDILIGGLFLSASSLGQYQIIKRIANFANMPQIIANWAVVVSIGQAFAENLPDKIQDQAQRAMQLSLLPLVLINIFLIGGAPMILSWFEITMTAEVWMLLALLLIGCAANVIFGVNFVVASQCKLEKSAFVSRLIGLACCMVLILVLQPDDSRFIAIAYVAGTIISNTWLWRRVYMVLTVDTSVIAFLKKGLRIQDEPH